MYMQRIDAVSSAAKLLMCAVLYQAYKCNVQGSNETTPGARRGRRSSRVGRGGGVRNRKAELLLVPVFNKLHVEKEKYTSNSCEIEG